LLTPSALEHCDDPADWLRREIDPALANQRNTVPLMLEGFDFGTPKIANQLTGKLAALKDYNGLSIPPEYFDEAMERLRRQYLNVPLTAVLHPPSLFARQAATEQKAAAEAAPTVQEKELTAQQWFERGFAAADVDEKLRLYTEAIRLKPDYADAFNNRGLARQDKGDLDGALQDYNEAIRLKPDHAYALMGRGNVRSAKGDLDSALQDYTEAIRLKPDYAEAFKSRRLARLAKFVRGGMWVNFGLLFWVIGWWWSHADATEAIRNFVADKAVGDVIGYAIYIGAVLVIGKGLVELLTAIRGAAQLRKPRRPQ
jgi:tetratricopeptide (TPR) repeat protein